MNKVYITLLFLILIIGCNRHMTLNKQANENRNDSSYNNSDLKRNFSVEHDVSHINYGDTLYGGVTFLATDHFKEDSAESGGIKVKFHFKKDSLGNTDLDFETIAKPNGVTNITDKEIKDYENKNLSGAVKKNQKSAEMSKKVDSSIKAWVFIVILVVAAALMYFFVLPHNPMDKISSSFSIIKSLIHRESGKSK